MLSISDKSVVSAVVTKGPLHYKTRELDRHIAPLFSSIRYHVVHDYSPWEEHKKWDKTYCYPSLPFRSVSIGKSSCEECRHPSEQRRQGFNFEEAEMSGNGRIPERREQYQKGDSKACIGLPWILFWDLDWDRVSCSPGYPETQYVKKNDFEHFILSLHPKCCDYRYEIQQN